MKKAAKASRKKNTRAPRRQKSFFIRFRILFPLACVMFGMFVGVFEIVLRMNGLTPHFCANSISCINDLSGAFKPVAEATYLGKKVAIPPFIAEAINPKKAVLGASVGPKHIYIDLTNQRLMAFEGNAMVYSFTVATGWWNKTPTGDFTTWIKLRYGRMTGGSGVDYYDLPNIPYIMYLYNAQHPKYEGYGIHDAYWLSDADFGHPRSHGCINLKYSDAENLYTWALPSTTAYTTYASDSNPGTPVTIYGTTPNHYW